MKLICGIDEAGRGPIAGPVTAAAVLLPPNFPTEILNDSKKLSHPARMAAARRIQEQALAWGIGWAWPSEIDRYNIHHATLLAMRRAFLDLDLYPDETLVDGLFVPDIPGRGRAIVKGDESEPAIQAASILAKTARDRWMVRYDWIEPGYRFGKHKGYGTAEHRKLVMEFGPSRIHRMSFRRAWMSSETDGKGGK